MIYTFVYLDTPKFIGELKQDKLQKAIASPISGTEFYEGCFWYIW